MPHEDSTQQVLRLQPVPPLELPPPMMATVPKDAPLGDNQHQERSRTEFSIMTDHETVAIICYRSNHMLQE